VSEVATVAPPPAPETPAPAKPESRLARGWTGFVGSVVEAWAELRIHKTRVLLSLVGVGVAVTALTGVVAAGAIATQATTESFERSSGRPAALMIGAYNIETGAQPNRSAFDDAFRATMERYDVTYTSRVTYGGYRVQFPDGVMDVQSIAVDRPYGAMHRIDVERGAWFTERDELRLAPAIIISEEVWARLGSPDLSTHPTIEIVTPTGSVDTVVVGITAARSPDGSDLLTYVLTDDYDRIVPPDPVYPIIPNYEAWVPPENVDQLIPLIQQDLAGALGTNWQVDVSRQDYLAWQGEEDPTFQLKAIVTGIAVLVMALGALGLLNIALVTVKHRIREIGIRRAFGATAGRVFFGVLMESVVATFIAGVAGVLLAIVLIRNPITEGLIAEGVQDIPGFPIEAALIGLGAATLVGALAGLLPALVAVRVKVIDAIRY
jgi:putative ABC transport system permease protein